MATDPIKELDEVYAEILGRNAERLRNADKRDHVALRDYFAASALMGLLASGRDGRVEFLTERAYQCADAMLVERVKEKGLPPVTGEASSHPPTTLADDVALDEAEALAFAKTVGEGRGT